MTDDERAVYGVHVEGVDPEDDSAEVIAEAIESVGYETHAVIRLDVTGLDRLDELADMGDDR